MLTRGLIYLDEYGEGYDAVRTIEGLAVSAVQLRIESEDLQLPSLKHASLLNCVINGRRGRRLFINAQMTHALVCIDLFLR